MADEMDVDSPRGSKRKANEIDDDTNANEDTAAPRRIRVRYRIPPSLVFLSAC
jgi:hypothetical protein